jgi:hypothetical protein
MEIDDGAGTKPVPGPPNPHKPGPTPTHATDTRAGEPAPAKPGLTGPAHAFLRSEKFLGLKPNRSGFFPAKKTTG